MKPKRFLPIRDKVAAHKRTIKSVESGSQKVWISAEGFLGIFRSDLARQAAKEDIEREKELIKIEDVKRHLEEIFLADVSVENIRAALASTFASGNAEMAAQLLELQTQAGRGIILPYDPNIQMAGAVNRENVTCWLDSLLFAMFAKLDAFECMLNADFSGDPRRHKLVLLLRLWINTLRSGNLIHVDLTKLLQDALASCGWQDARRLEQQDTSEAFGFITELLELPLLSLQVDLFHNGRNDKDDHKVVYERLLNLAIPPCLDGKGIKLEDCLEEYFNARVDVTRFSHDDKKSETESQRPATFSGTTIRFVTETDEVGMLDVLLSPILMSPSESENQLPATRLASDIQSDVTSSSVTSWRPSRNRTTSIIERVVLNEQDWSDDTNSFVLQKAVRTSSKVVKALTIPAWQFFRLIPWHAAAKEEPRNDADVLLNFQHRPVVGICLKRYSMTETGQAKRQNTFIDIPDSLRLPNFMLLNEKLEQSSDALCTEYKLVLQSVVCHRGDSTQSGHYIAFARVAPKLLTGNRKHHNDPPPDYEEAQWVRFDDLCFEKRVTYVDDIKQCLKDDMPYLLFYQILPMVDLVAAPLDEQSMIGLPSYDASVDALTIPPTPPALRGHSSLPPQPDMEYFTTEGISTQQSQAFGRFSADFERPIWNLSGNETSIARSLGTSRRTSVNLTDSTIDFPAQDSASSCVTPVEESTAQRLSRAAARLARSNKSLGNLQIAEGRTSMSKSRFGLMRTSKDPLNDLSREPAEDLAKAIEGESPPKGHKRAKSKDKAKVKPSQPERECVVM